MCCTAPSRHQGFSQERKHPSSCSKHLSTMITSLLDYWIWRHVGPAAWRWQGFYHRYPFPDKSEKPWPLWRPKESWEAEKKATNASMLLLSLGFFSYMHLCYPYISFYLPLQRTFSVYVWLTISESPSPSFIFHVVLVLLTKDSVFVGASTFAFVGDCAGGGGGGGRVRGRRPRRDRM